MEEKRLEMRSKGQISSDSTTAYPCLGSSSAAAAAGGGGGGLGDAGNEDDDDDLVFPGFRFHPTDEELVGFYLTRKVEKKAFSIEIIKEIDIYKHDPWDLPKASHGGGVLLLQGSSSSEKEKEKEWYFFCLRGRKYRNSIRPNRVTGSGFWKATGIDKPIYSAAAAGGGCIGLKKSLVYYRGSAGRGTKTDWMMHEFRLPPPPSSPDHDAANLQDAEIWTVCRIFKRSMSYTKGRAAAAAASASMIGGKRSHHQLQLQQQQQHYYCSYYSCSASASMAPPASIVERAHVANNNIPRHRHHHLQLAQSPSLSSSSAAVTVSTVTGGSLTAASGLSDMLSFRDGGSNSWDELGRIMEVSKFC